MDSKTKTSEPTILYGKWPIDPDNPGEAIQVSQVLESQGVDWFPKDSLILVKVSDMIRIWDQDELQLSRVFRKTTTGVLSSGDFNIIIQKPGYARIEVLGGRGVINMESGRVVAWHGFRDEATMIDCMKKFFDYQE